MMQREIADPRASMELQAEDGFLRSAGPQIDKVNGTARVVRHADCRL